MEIALNDDWASAQQRLAAFWEREIVDRPCLQVYVRPSVPDVETAVDPQQYWTDPATFFAGEQARYLRTGCLGEAFPVLYSNYRVVPLLAGAAASYAPDTIWYHPLAGSLAEIDLSGFSLAHPVVQRMAAILAYAAEGFEKCQIGMARSRDGIHDWECYPGNPIIGPGPAGSWDDCNTYKPYVVHFHEEWYLWYNASRFSDRREQIGLATTPELDF